MKWPTDLDKMLKPYGRWPIAIIDKQGRTWKRSETKGWFTYVEYDDRPSGGYCGHSRHITHPELMFGKYIWNKRELK